MTANRRRQGMTLIELLSVVFIIGLLAAILVPVLAKARHKSKRIKAYTESRELVKAWEAYWHAYTNWPSGLQTGNPIKMTPAMVKVLIGDDPNNNPWGIKFMEFPPSALEEDVDAGVEAGFRDPWGRKCYRVLLGEPSEIVDEWTYATRVHCQHWRRTP